MNARDRFEQTIMCIESLVLDNKLVKNEIGKKVAEQNGFQLDEEQKSPIKKSLVRNNKVL